MQTLISSQEVKAKWCKPTRSKLPAVHVAIMSLFSFVLDMRLIDGDSTLDPRSAVMQQHTKQAFQVL